MLVLVQVLAAISIALMLGIVITGLGVSLHQIAVLAEALGCGAIVVVVMARTGKRRAAANERKRLMLQAADIAAMAPIAFEHHCAAVLQAQGWRCRITRASGDFGVDIVAEHSGARVVIQVKKWCEPVNLSAVQEAAAGMAMYRATHGAVVSVSGYRQSARRLARANKVRLLDYPDLFNFTPPARQASR